MPDESIQRNGWNGFTLCCVFITAQLVHNATGGFVGKKSTVLPLNRKSAIPIRQQLNQVWVQGPFSYESCSCMFCDAELGSAGGPEKYPKAAFPGKIRIQFGCRAVWAAFPPRGWCCAWVTPRTSRTGKHLVLLQHVRVCEPGGWRQGFAFSLVRTLQPSGLEP